MHAGKMARFCEELGWTSDLAPCFAAFVKRLDAGAKPEVLELTEIHGVGVVRARALYEAGYQSVRAVSVAKPEDLSKLQLGRGRNAGMWASKIVRCAKELLEKRARQLRQLAEEVEKVAQPTT
eukprot:TRINITY_DN86_c0_g4_i2.p1 TRINITY_DN86_c0_g4~~TRINITY_DN86_c0_g4_i2.p1  ORF type:complete len:123 (+),score=36.61 TRINITY_DN86_c0_g4_i2:335-703(+)